MFLCDSRFCETPKGCRIRASTGHHTQVNHRESQSYVQKSLFFSTPYLLKVGRSINERPKANIAERVPMDPLRHGNMVGKPTWEGHWAPSQNTFHQPSVLAHGGEPPHIPRTPIPQTSSKQHLLRLWRHDQYPRLSTKPSRKINHVQNTFLFDIF